MIKRLIVVICFFLGVLVIVTWLLQANGEMKYLYGRRENTISLILLAMLWGTPFFLTGTKDDDNKNQ